MHTVDLEKWRGKRDPEVLDPSSIQFRAQPIDRASCAGCMFQSLLMKHY